LKLGGGARPLALGGAYTALGNDASSLFYNPAGLGRMNFPEVMTMYNSWLADTKQQAAIVAFPLRFGTVAFGYTSLSSGNIQGYDATGALTSVFDTGSTVMSLSLGRSLNPNLFWGFSVKTISDRLETVTARTTAFDAGMTLMANPNLIIGVSAMNFGSGLVYVSEKTALPTCYRLGIAYKANLLNESIRVAGDLAAYPDGTKVDLGMEYLVRDFLAFRLGDSGGNLRAGIGVIANILAIDYAYYFHQDLGATHQVSISFLFGAPEQTKKMVLENMAYGKAYLKEGKYADAILRFNKVLALDPQNEDAGLLLKKAQNELENQALEKVFAQKEGEIKRSAEEIMTSGRSYLDQKQYIEAMAEFSKVLKLDPSNKEALKLQSEAQFRMESALIKRSKVDAIEFLGKAMKSVVAGKYQDAMEQVTAALARDPKNQEVIALQKKLAIIIKLGKKQENQ